MHIQTPHCNQKLHTRGQCSPWLASALAVYSSLPRRQLLSATADVYQPPKRCIFLTAERSGLKRFFVQSLALGASRSCKMLMLRGAGGPMPAREKRVLRRSRVPGVRQHSWVAILSHSIVLPSTSNLQDLQYLGAQCLPLYDVSARAYTGALLARVQT